jgi:dihydrofolate synthase/folylpolyglutamate synthase
MNYEDALNYLKKIQELGAKLSLENIQKLIDYLPFDINKIKFIQVAGTNGKGSTAHFITSILKTGGYKVGLFTSPHLQDIKERITINKTWITREEFSKCVQQVKESSEQLLKEEKILNMPTFFETLFLTALFHFFNQKVNFAILEVGLGGRLDATSTITPEVSVITSISYDHPKNLGNTLKEIAFEKAGIIKGQVPVVCGCKKNSIADKTIKKVAKEKSAEYHNAFDSKNILESSFNGDYFTCIYRTPSDTFYFDVHMNGEHQTKNASIAITTIKVLIDKGIQVSRNAIQKGIKDNFVPGRIEIINTSPPVILDGGHNLDSINALRSFLLLKNKHNLTLIFGVLRDKQYKKMIGLLLPFIKNVIITEPISKRFLPAEELSSFFKTKNAIIIKDLKEAFDAAKRFDQEILITGSLYLTGEMRNIIFHGGYNGV